MTHDAPPLDDRVRRLVVDLNLGRADEVTEVTPLTGGVASDIARITVAGRRYCVKFALAKLRVAADWHAPVHRSRAEYAWLSAAAGVVSDAVPGLHGYSDAEGGFAMDNIAGPGVYLWKKALLAGAPDGGEAATVADVLGRIHAAAARPGFDRKPFNNAADFHALRVEPYLLHTASRHPSLETPLRALAHWLDQAAISLVHGDVSPKNILFRGGKPVLLDAECATMGDPCFDMAFCVNHLIIKSIHLPASRASLRKAVLAFRDAYLRHVDWEPAQAIEARTAALIPALMLARVDGKSPVDYLTAEGQKQVRESAVPLIAKPVARIDGLLGALQE
jgi:aminoglycoside phosphotransferase (APT) family kinase protein